MPAERVIFGFLVLFAWMYGNGLVKSRLGVNGGKIKNGWVFEGTPVPGMPGGIGDGLYADVLLFVGAG